MGIPDLVPSLKRWKLRIDMVPEPLWRMNLRSNGGLGKHRWKNFRAEIIAKRGLKCAICKSLDRPHGHEIWKYEERQRTGTARLIGIEIICGDCHAVHHWGRTNRTLLGTPGGSQELKRLIRHACKLNRSTEEDFDLHAQSTMFLWRRRSGLRWKIDWGQYREAVLEAKAARVEREIRIENARRNPGPKRKPSTPRKPVEPEKTHEQRMFDGDGPPPRKRIRTDRASRAQR